MVLAGSHEGTVSLLTLDKDVPSGSRSSSVGALLGETFRLLATHLNLFTLLSLTVWLPGHVLRNYFEFFEPEDGASQSLRAMLASRSCSTRSSSRARSSPSAGSRRGCPSGTRWR